MCASKKQIVKVDYLLEYCGTRSLWSMPQQRENE